MLHIINSHFFKMAGSKSVGFYILLSVVWAMIGIALFPVAYAQTPPPPSSTSTQLILSLISGPDASPASDRVEKVGTQQKTYFRFGLKAFGEAQKLSALVITARSTSTTPLATSTVTNINLYENNATTPFAHRDRFDTCSLGVCKLTLELGPDNWLSAPVPTTGTTTITVKADVGQPGTVNLGDNFRFLIASTLDVKARGASSNTGTPISGAPAATGHTFVVPQQVLIEAVSPLAATQVDVSSGQTVGVFKVTNNGLAPIYATGTWVFANSGNATTSLLLLASAQGGSSGDVSVTYGTTPNGRIAAPFNLIGVSEANRTINGGSYRYYTIRTSGVTGNNNTFQFSVGALGRLTFAARESDLGYSGNVGSGDNDLGDTITNLYIDGRPSLATVTAASPPPPGGFWSRLINRVTSVFIAQPSVDLKVKAPWDAPDENYTDGPIQIPPGSSLRVSWQSSKVQDCRMNYFGLLPTNLGATAEGQAGEPVSHLGNPDGDSRYYTAPNEEGVMEFEFQCRKETDGFEISDRVRVNVEALTAGTAGGITPPAPPAAPAGGLRGLLNAIRRVPETARTAVQKAIEIVITRPQAPTPDTAEPVGTTPKPAEPVGVTPKPAEPAGVKQQTDQRGGGVQAPITDIKEPAQTVPPIAGIAIPSLTNNVLDLGKAHSITWQYQRGGEVQAPVVHLYLVGEGIDPTTGKTVRAYKYIGSVSAGAGRFAWSVPADFAKPAEPRNDITFTYRIGIGLSANSADPQLQSTSNPITVPVPSKTAPSPTTIEPTRTSPPPPPTTVEPTRTTPPPPPTTIEPTRTEPSPPPPPPSTISEPIKVSPPTVDIKANKSDGPISLAYNTAATLSWTSANAASCTASNAWSGAKAISGSQSTGLLTASKTYTLTCSNKSGSVSDSVTVNVQAKLKLNYNESELQQTASILAQLLEIVKKLNALME